MYVAMLATSLPQLSFIIYIPYRGNFLRTTNFAVSWILQLPRKLILENLIIVYKCNDSLVDPRNLIREMHHWAVTSKIFSLKNYPLYGSYAWNVDFSTHFYDLTGSYPGQWVIWVSNADPVSTLVDTLLFSSGQIAICLMLWYSV